MKIIIIRHGDPDYSIDSLTDKGWKEAGFLAERMSHVPVTEFYVSPLGRAMATASLTLNRVNASAKVMDWLREFDPRVCRPDLADSERRCAWDWLPEDWMTDPLLMDRDHWYDHPAFVEAGVKERFLWVTDNFDRLLADYGYVREGNYYRAVRPNHDTICLFCHFGVECVLLSRLLNVSPMILWHGFCAAPTSVTTINTEERREGNACFRISSFGDVSHLYAAGEEVSRQARFCECFSDNWDRHD